MSNAHDIENNVTFLELANWGLLRHVRKEKLIDAYLLESPRPNDEIGESLLKQWCKKHSIDSDESLKNWQNKNGLSNEMFRDLVYRNWRWANWCLHKFKSKISSYYLERKTMLDKVSYSLLRVEDELLANELYLRIKEGEATFADIASNYSEGLEKNRGGLIGPVQFNKPHPLLARLLQVSHEGQLWPPKKIDTWWIVIRLEKLHTTSLNDELSLGLAVELGNTLLDKILDQ